MRRENPEEMLSALLMLERFLGALRVALRDREFGRVVGAAVALVVVGALAYTFGAYWSVVAASTSRLRRSRRRPSSIPT